MGWLKKGQSTNPHIGSKDWWLYEFSVEEIEQMRSAFTPMGNIPLEAMLEAPDPSALATLAGHFKKKNLRHLGYRVLDRADFLVGKNVSPVSLHFYFQARGDFYYRWRDEDADALEQAVESFKRQIGLAESVEKDLMIDFGDERRLPGHAGYRQLRIIEEKRGNLTLAKALCLQAKKEGWADDWDKHIRRLDKKIAAITA